MAKTVQKTAAQFVTQDMTGQSNAGVAEAARRNKAAKQQQNPVPQQ
jgi:hypothetical protein